jgi:hypothetical protein
VQVQEVAMARGGGLEADGKLAESKEIITDVAVGWGDGWRSAAEAEMGGAAEWVLAGLDLRKAFTCKDLGQQRASGVRKIGSSGEKENGAKCELL